MSPENTHKLMGFYMAGLILGVNTLYRLFCFFKLFLIGCIGLIKGRDSYIKLVVVLKVCIFFMSACLCQGWKDRSGGGRGWGETYKFASLSGHCVNHT